jgi:hypothetical protein
MRTTMTRHRSIGPHGFSSILVTVASTFSVEARSPLMFGRGTSLVGRRTTTATRVAAARTAVRAINSARTGAGAGVPS